MATRKRPGWGGPRLGAGRSPRAGDAIRRNRVATTLTDAELAVLKRLAKKERLPVGTMLYDLVKERLR